MGSIGSFIIIAIVVISMIVRILKAVLGNEQNRDQTAGKRRSLEDWDELQARRRAELAEQARRREAIEAMQREPAGQQPTYANQPDPSQMTMAQRIELARQRARQQQGGGVPNVDAQAEALNRARAQQELQEQQRRTLAQQQAQQQAQREEAEAQRAARERARQQAERKRVAEQRAKAEQERTQQMRSSRRRTTSGAKSAQASASAISLAKSSQMRAQSYQRVHEGHEHVAKKGAVKSVQIVKRRAKIGPLDAASLRRAFIMKELLDKPIALRKPQDDLLS